MFARLFVLEHNRIAIELHRLNPIVDSEIIYQEARRLNIAQYQHIVYGEFLPILLGSFAMKTWDLTPQYGYEYFNGYNKHVYPQNTNAFVISCNQIKFF